MKSVVAVFADFVNGPLGGMSALHEQLNGQRTIEHTLRRVARVQGASAYCVVVRPRDAHAANEAVRRAGCEEFVEVLAIDDAPRPRAHLIQAARRWGSNSWRGTPLSTTWFDEFVEPLATARVLDHYGAESVLCLEGHQAAFDPALASDMIDHQERQLADAKLVFSPAPPGLCGVILRGDTVRDLLEGQFPLGMLLTYRPEIPQPDPLTKPVCMPVAPHIAGTRARLMADTRRGRELLAAAMADRGADADAEAICDWFAAASNTPRDPLPIELEIELTTDDLLPAATLRLRGARVPKRHLDDIAALRRIATELAEYDDRRVMLGGFGDPLLHPRFPEICATLRNAGVACIGVVTPLVELRDEIVEALFSTPVDLVQVRVDAHSAATYQRVHGADFHERVIGNVMKLEETRQARTAPRPIVICSLTRCAATIDEMEVFYDHWMRTLGGALIEGFDSYGGRLAADTLIPLTPPIRRACQQIERRLLLLADGTVPQCDQDFTGQSRLGDWREASLASLWGGDAITRLRQLHSTGHWNDMPLCSGCTSWHRP